MLLHLVACNYSHGGLPANPPQVLLAKGRSVSAGMYVNAWSTQYAALGKGVTLQHMLCTTQDRHSMQAGHALAAASEGVGVQHVGAFTLLLLPGAYVALDSGALAALGPWRTLRVSPLLGFVRHMMLLWLLNVVGRSLVI